MHPGRPARRLGAVPLVVAAITAVFAWSTVLLIDLWRWYSPPDWLEGTPAMASVSFTQGPVEWIQWATLGALVLVAVRRGVSEWRRARPWSLWARVALLAAVVLVEDTVHLRSSAASGLAAATSTRLGPFGTESVLLALELVVFAAVAVALVRPVWPEPSFDRLDRRRFLIGAACYAGASTLHLPLSEVKRVLGHALTNILAPGARVADASFDALHRVLVGSAVEETLELAAAALLLSVALRRIGTVGP